MTMNDDIKKYPIFILTKDGKLRQTDRITSTADYNHSTLHLHHFIPKGNYKRNKAWYDEHGIKQKLILLPISTHEQVHNQAVRNLEDDDFYGWYKIDRWKLIFNRRYSEY